MAYQKENIILLPHVKQTLEETVQEQLEERNYEAALESIHTLLNHGIHTYEIHIGKLISLMHLKRLDEALAFCESILDEQSEHYLDYVDYYVMVLFEKGHYLEVVEEIESLRENHVLTSAYEDKFKKIYEVTSQMNRENAGLIVAKFMRAVGDGDHLLQWHYLHQLKKYRIPFPDMFLDLLIDPLVHPVIKTYILDWYQESGAEDSIEVEKFNQQVTVNLADLASWNEHPTYIEVIEQVQSIEQNNPSLHEIIIALLESYIYVHYPIVEEENVAMLVEALIIVAHTHLALDQSQAADKVAVTKYLDVIHTSHELYVSIVST